MDYAFVSGGEGRRGLLSFCRVDNQNAQARDFASIRGKPQNPFGPQHRPNCRIVILRAAKNLSASTVFLL